MDLFKVCLYQALLPSVLQLNSTRSVGPPQEHIQGEEWWTNYQPVSYKLESRFGNRQQFADMIASCQTAGVKVIVGMCYDVETQV